jgi:NADH dehydrogenase [ubiquinone] 1 alpha subcomplex assembly factor 5
MLLRFLRRRRRLVGCHIESCRQGLSNIVFDRELKNRQKAFAYHRNGSDYFDYLRKETTDRLADRLDDISRQFPLALELGSHRGYFRDIIKNSIIERNGVAIGGIQSLVESDTFQKICSTTDTSVPSSSAVTNEFKVNSLVCDEEKIPFPAESFDLIISPFSLHWINELPATLTSIKRTLKPDGVFLGAMLGGSTLEELRYCFYLADLERRGGITPHTSPFALASDVTALMQAAGFSLPTIDVDTLQVSYPDAISLMEHLSSMGEGTAALNRQLHAGRDTLLAAAALYQQMYGLEDGSVSATFQVIYMIGWSPDDSQPKPCQRGSASRSLRDLSTHADT